MLITFPKYVMRELAKAFGISLLVFVFAFLGMYCALIINEGASLSTAFGLLPHFFPLISPFALPLAIITGILICYGRLSANNEFVGSQASGIHPIWVALPALAVAGLSSLITVYLNDEVLTSSVASIERSLMENKAEIVRGRLAKPGSFVFPINDEQSLAICRLPSSWSSTGRVGVDLTIFRRAGTGETPPQGWDPAYPYPEVRSLARHHEISIIDDKQSKDGAMTLNCRFEDGTDFMFSGDMTYIVEGQVMNKFWVLPKSSVSFTISKDRNQYKGIDRLRLEKRNLENDRTQSELQIHQQAARIVGALSAVIAASPAATAVSAALEKESAEAVKKNDLPQMRTLIGRLQAEVSRQKLAVSKALTAELQSFGEGQNAVQNYDDQILARTAEINVKLVMSFACISFAMIGIPVGLISRRGGSMIGFVVGLGFAFAFYMVITALHGAVRDGSLPWWGLWVPDLLVLAMGVVLWFRSIRTMC